MQVTRNGAPVLVEGEPIRRGATLPKFTLTDAHGAYYTTAMMLGTPALISVVPDINTRVCSISTKKFNQDVDQFPGINFYTISTNPVGEQQNWCAAEGVQKMQLLSDSEGSFGRAMGLFIPTSNVLVRSIFIIDGKGEIRYQEIIDEQTHEPDYDAALSFLETHFHD
ncbi:MAG: peroxiredoxin [Schleiferilactobacillus harbinensis]|jgi:thiol peroxidase|nr:peroxiredoxin [Schleiferilactobacillus harbinensis]MCI1912170.1 peroxiredoxin [Schleiferilactobacillus harbinensis]